MLSCLTTGTLLGLSAGFAPGPLLTLVVSQTLKHNAREGVKVAMAPLVTDVPIILASCLFLSNLAHFSPLLGLISFIGGMYVFYLAYENLRTGPVNVEISGVEPRSIRKGALINALNPHPYLFWFTVGAPILLRAWQKDSLSPGVFLASFYFSLIGSKAFLAWVVGKSRNFLMSRGYLWVMRALGGLLGLFALVLMKDAFVFWGIWDS